MSFDSHFLSVLASMLGRFWPQEVARVVQDGPKRGKMGVKKNAFLRIRAGTPSGGGFGLIFDDDFGDDFGRILEGF